MAREKKREEKERRNRKRQRERDEERREREGEKRAEGKREETKKRRGERKGERPRAQVPCPFPGGCRIRFPTVFGPFRGFIQSGFTSYGSLPRGPLIRQFWPFG